MKDPRCMYKCCKKVATHTCRKCKLYFCKEHAERHDEIVGTTAYNATYALEGGEEPKY